MDVARYEDIEELLQPISTQQPSGPDLSDEVFELQIKAEPPREAMVPSAEKREVPWEQIRQEAMNLAARTKDLRVAMFLTRSLAHRQGLLGFVQGLGLLEGLVERYWDTLHPQRPAKRRAILDELAGNDIVDAVRRAELFASPILGAISYREVAIATGALTVDSKEKQLDRSKIEAAFKDCERTVLEGLLATSALGIQRLQRLKHTFGAHFRPDELADLSELAKLLQSIQQFIAGRLEAHPSSTAEDEAAASQAPVSPRPASDGGALGSTLPVSGQVAGREDVVAMLEQISAYLKAHDPSNPLSLIIECARCLAKAPAR